jgi:hypothetical protein
MKEDNGFITLGVVLLVFFIITSWIFYSFFRFGGFYSPVYATGLSNPFQYYQKHISSLLIENGNKIDFDNHKSANLVSYKDSVDHYTFDYDSELDFEVNEFSNEVGKAITFYKDDSKQEKCTVEIIKKGRGIGARGLPEVRNHLEKEILSNGGDISYFQSKNGQIVRILENERESDAGFIGAMFINPSNDKFINITVYNESCSNLFVDNLFATFEFFG